MKKLLVSLTVIVIGLVGLRLFALTVDSRKPASAAQVYADMAAQSAGIITTKMTKSPNADKPRSMALNHVTQRIAMPPITPPPTATPGR